MNTRTRTWNVAGILMYTASALFLLRVLLTGSTLAAVAVFLLSLAGGLFLRAGATAPVSRPDTAT